MNDRSTSRPGERRRWTPRLATLGLLAIVGVLAAGCGDDVGGGAASADDRESEAREAALKYAECMREHGVDVPDPTFDGGRINQPGPDEDVPRAKVAEAQKACQKYLDEIEPPKLSAEQQQEFKEAVLAEARCMREHGIENFPDPTFGEDGRATIKIEGGSGFDEDDPDFKKAQKACQDELPDPIGEESAP